MKIELYDLLPAVYRNRDHFLGEPLHALLDVLGEELDAVRQDIDRLYETWFIETCDEWAVPYIGDLFAVGGLHPGRAGIFSLRAFVANTLAYRRRKGTASVLENIAQDVSGWSASVTEFFQLLVSAQHPNHVRPRTVWSLDGVDDRRVGTVGAIDLRKSPLLASIDTPFDTASRSIDIRPFGPHEGWYNIDRLGIFVWRLRSYPMREVIPRLAWADDVSGWRGFHLHPLGVSFPLFVNPVRQTGATERRREWEVPQAIGHDAFAADMERYYGDEKSLLLKERAAGAMVPVPLERIVAADLSDADPDGSEPHPWKTPESPADGAVRAYVDVELGRLVLDQPVPPEDLRVTYHYGFSGDIGGGPYGRLETAAEPDQRVILVAKGTPCDTLSDAVAAALEGWDCQTGQPVARATRNIIRILDSGIYEEDGGRMRIDIPAGDELVIEAADGARPTIVVHPQPGWHQGFFYALVLDPEGEGRASRLRLDGLLISGELLVEGHLKLELDHCTLLSPRFSDPRLETAMQEYGLSYGLEIDIRHSIVGPIKVSEDIKCLRIRDSIVGATHEDAGAMRDAEDRPHAICGSREGYVGPETTIERSTVFGRVFVRAMPLASAAIFTEQVVVERKQGGCMEYCYVAAVDDTVAASVSRTPRRFRCQPDLALEGIDDAGERARIRQGLRPAFLSMIHGQPGYARLASRCPDEIRKGAENGSEMGVFSHLMEPQREANVREAVRRYLPFGLEMNILYADEETQR